MTPEPVIVGSYPRDDVFTRWVDDGRTRSGHATVQIVGSDGSLTEVGTARLASLDTLSIDVPAGTSLVVDLEAEYSGQILRRRVTFTTTCDEDDVYVSAIGPGASAERGRGILGRTRYSGFEFGVLAMGATTTEGTRCSGSAALQPHGPGDGVGTP